MNTCKKGTLREREAINTDLQAGWKFLTRAIRSRFSSGELFGCWDYAVFGTQPITDTLISEQLGDFFQPIIYKKTELVGLVTNPRLRWQLSYVRKLVQVCDAHNYASHKEKCLEWLKTHRLAGEIYELAVYRDAHFEGRGAKKKWVKKSWRREVL